MTLQQGMVLNALITGFVVIIMIVLFGGFGLLLAPFIIGGSILGWVREDRRIRAQEDNHDRYKRRNRY